MSVNRMVITLTKHEASPFLVRNKGSYKNKTFVRQQCLRLVNFKDYKMSYQNQIEMANS